ncbi:carbohydrate ABC transporter permease [Gracilibacillus phocaeensis]|uniref:carbohydrate ABC transporter permease n=1 Tax=Gracilibacillus phocaeensis TaxID=2042304 RepID=UPI0013EF1825|nr:sugar ABC transporter permease [Gracilibacillus phocaeensis]
MNIRKNRKVIFLFLLPALLIYGIFEFIPSVMSIYFSFNQWPGIQSVPLEFVGLDNYIDMFRDPMFLKSLGNITIYVIASLLLQIPIGFALGFTIFNFTKGKKFFKAAFFVPMIMSLTAVSLLWYFIYFPTDQGVLNNLLMNIGVLDSAHNWLVDTNTALASVIIVTAWTSVGYYMLICLTGLTAIPGSILEAAELDGAVGLKKIRYITLPLLSSSVKISVIMVITGVLKIFDHIYILTPSGGAEGSTMVPALLMYNEAFRYDNYGMGSAIATVILVLSITVSVISLKLLNRQQTVEY